MDTEDLYSENQALQETNEEIAKEIKNFNWGAFGFSWIWGLCNGVYNEIITPCFILFIIGFFKINRLFWFIPGIGKFIFPIIIFNY